MTNVGRLQNVDFFKGRRVLVTGHTGFKGAWLAAVLNFMGADAAGYALAPKPGCLYERICGDGLIQNVTGDLMDVSLLNQTIEKVQPEIVIHLAGAGLCRECFREPLRTFQTNLMGGTVLLEALRSCTSVKSIVLESICRTFDNKNSSTAYHGGEDSAGADPYVSSRICMEYMARDYRKLYFQTDSRMTGVAAVRTGGVPSGEKLMQAKEKLMQAGESISDQKYIVEKSADGMHRLFISGCQQHVLDILDSYLTVARLLYEKPAAYAGEWDITLANHCARGYKSELIYEKAAGQKRELFKCGADVGAVREICMGMISAYYENQYL